MSLTVLYVTGLGEVGVNVKRIRLMDLSVAERFSFANEQKALRLLASTERPAGFSDAWTCKEACLRALGCGLLHVAGAPAEAPQWQVVAFVPTDGHVGAGALCKSDWHLRRHNSPPSDRTFAGSARLDTL